MKSNILNVLKSTLYPSNDTTEIGKEFWFYSIKFKLLNFLWLLFSYFSFLLYINLELTVNHKYMSKLIFNEFKRGEVLYKLNLNYYAVWINYLANRTFNSESL